jgi:hypothetical protein
VIFDELYGEARAFGVNNDLRDEELHIEHGRRTGQLSRREARRLRRQLSEARELEWAALYDGLLTAEEEADLYWAERELNQAIRSEMRDFDRW